MQRFMNADFLLQNPTAQTLYRRHAVKMPIIDYHCHIDPRDIYEDRRYETITQLWLGGDHYKWRAMRAAGVAEEYITGPASDGEKFQKWAQTVPQLIGNPLYHWTHLELQRYFGIHEPLNGENAMAIYDKCNAQLPELSARNILRQSNVQLLCTTDDPADDLRWHKRMETDPTMPAVVLPAFRPDKAMRADKPDFPQYLAKLETAVGYEINTMDDLRRALTQRVDFFNAHGCRTADHGLDYAFFEEATDSQLNDTFLRAKAGKPITRREQLAYHTALLLDLSKVYKQYGWVSQLHFGCIRDNSVKMFRKLGPDTGFDAINDAANAPGLSRLLSAMEETGGLTKTVLYSLNPTDNAVIDSLMGCFQTDSPIPGRLQHGSAWWFNDHKPGMEAQMTSLMNLGVMGSFIGMLTDSRSLLSYTRHEYFRRILCNLLGQLVENGEYPADMDHLGQMVENICYYNTLRYFRFGEFLM